MPTPLKEKLREFLQENQLERASQELIRHIPASSALSSAAVLLSARLKDLLHKEQHQLDQADTLQVWKNKWIHDFDNLLKKLPKGQHYLPPKEAAELEKEAKEKPKGLPVDTFKWRVFLTLVISKGLVLAYLYYLWDRGGFYSGNYITLIGVLLPIFTASATLMIKDYFDRQKKPEPYAHDLVSPRTQWISHILIIGYALFIIFSARNYSISRGAEKDDFENFMSSINYIEASLGVGIGYLTATYFNGKS